MQRTPEQLREDALQIWRAGVDAAKPARLVPEHLAIEGRSLCVKEHEFDLDSIDRIVIVGAGKASGAMAVAVEAALGEVLLTEKHVSGWVNVPADCVVPTQAVRLFAARPAGVNEPTTACVEGTREILHLVEGLGPRDLCLCLLSGGGSALLSAPSEGISLETKIGITREIIARGGDIRQLNTVRRELSQMKGGGLARASRAGYLVSLILSDVLGDDLEMIASGPTSAGTSNPAAALKVLVDLQLLETPHGRAVAEVLQKERKREPVPFAGRVENFIIGNNATAVDGAGIEAERRGYSHAMLSATRPEGTAEEVGSWLAETAEHMRRKAGPDCLISGGETTVKLVPESRRGRGGRNQQLALAAMTSLDDWTDLAIMSGGTDGEDGPTDAAGALLDATVVESARANGLDADGFLMRNDAYTFFDQTGGLIRTGPTGTNVCDLRVVCVNQDDATVGDDVAR